MSQWEKLKQAYTTQFPLNAEELKFIPFCFKDSFAANKLGTRTLFALFDDLPVSTITNACKWRYLSSGEPVNKEQIFAWFPYQEILQNLNIYTRTGQFQDKNLYLDNHKEWRYLNHRKVHFHGSEASQSDQEETPNPEEEEYKSEDNKSEDNSESEEENSHSEPGSNTAQVDALLQSAEESIHSAIEKSASKPNTPLQEASLLPRIPRDPSPEPSQVPTPPVSKGKQPVPPPRPCTLVPTTSVPKRPATPPIPPKLPLRGQSLRSTMTTVSQSRAAPQTSTPVPTVPVMAQNNHKLLGSPPEPFEGKADQALAFWNTLENYYNINVAIYTVDSTKIATALTHFKQRTQAGEWASDLMATALGQNPINYGTWADFKTAFEKQFIPPETQVQAIAQMYACKMGNREFNEWYQEWSQHA